MTASQKITSATLHCTPLLSLLRSFPATPNRRRRPPGSRQASGPWMASLQNVTGVGRSNIVRGINSDRFVSHAVLKVPGGPAARGAGSDLEARQLGWLCIDAACLSEHYDPHTRSSQAIEAEQCQYQHPQQISTYPWCKRVRARAAAAVFSNSGQSQSQRTVRAMSSASNLADTVGFPGILGHLCETWFRLSVTGGLHQSI